jgi:hypothetical protein
VSHAAHAIRSHATLLAPSLLFCVVHEQAPAEWFCGDCVILRQLEQQREVLAQQRQQAGGGVPRLQAIMQVVSPGRQQESAGALTQYDAMRQLLLNALSKKGGDTWIVEARHMHVAQWVAEDLKHQNSATALHFLQQVSRVMSRKLVSQMRECP